MSTNYYARTTDTPADSEGLHIGQRIVGWEFLFRGHPELDLMDCTAWHAFLSRPEVEIVTESGSPTSLADFWPHATQRPAEASPRLRCRFVGDRRRLGEVEDIHGHPFRVTEFC